MVDESHASGSAGRIPGNAKYPLRPNSQADRLQVGHIVKPNFLSSTALQSHPRGMIRDITNGVATVRWEGWQEEQYCIHCLVIVET